MPKTTNMVLWFLLFGLIVAISFVLAYQSMHDFQEKAASSGIENTVYLVRHPLALNQQVLDLIYAQTVSQGYIVSIERLFKGNQAAVVIFGPKHILDRYTQHLHLLELEDYTKVDQTKVTAWEMGVKDMFAFHLSFSENFFKKISQLGHTDQFWWQIVLQPQKQNWLFNVLNHRNAIVEFMGRMIGSPSHAKSYDLVVNKNALTDGNVRDVLHRKSLQKSFLVQVRCLVFALDDNKRVGLAEILEKAVSDKMVKIPKPISSPQIYELYKARSIPVTNETSVFMTSEEILQMALNFKS